MTPSDATPPKIRTGSSRTNISELSPTTVVPVARQQGGTPAFIARRAASARDNSGKSDAASK